VVGWTVPAWSASGSIPWCDSLVADGGGRWRARAIVRVVNEGPHPAKGELVQVTVGRGPGQVDLAGQRAQAVRVCDALGRELLFDLADRDGRTKRTGPLADGDRVSFCVECAASKRGGKDRRVSGASDYVVYYDNAQATDPVDYLGAGLTNGGFELGGASPDGWAAHGVDEMHRVSCVSDRPHSGRRCGRTTVTAGAEPAWVKWWQGNIPVTAGARYRLTGWVRARDVKGKAGWYVHVHADRRMVVNRVATAGDGTYDWRKVTIEFSTPPGARAADLGTLLYGAGTAWFDDVSLERVDDRLELKVASVAVERRDLKELSSRSAWLLPAERWPWRVPVAVANPGDRRAADTVLSVNLNRIRHQIAGPGQSVRIAVIDPARTGSASTSDALPSLCLDRSWMFIADLPARCVKTFHVYLARVDGHDEGAKPSGYDALLRSPANLVKNGDFESGDKMPQAWLPGSGWPKKGKPQCRCARATGGRFGKHCARLDIPPDARLQWSGWKQGPIPVQPSTSYLYAGWLKSQGVNDGTVTLYGHFHGADGKLSKGTQFFSTGKKLSGDTDWTLSRTLVQTPADCTSVILHLTMHAHGTVWHDGIVLCRAIEARTRSLETARPARVADDRPVDIWQVNPLVKVFRENTPQKQLTSIRTDAAGNEYEPIQLAIRGRKPLRNIRVDVTPLRCDGRSLPPVQVHRVGYVPVDVPSAYYQSKLPAWYRLIPRGTARADGWAGEWPDPLPPCTPFDLPADQTQPIWLTVHAPAGTPAGMYRGQVTIRADGGVTERIPLTVNVWPFELPARPSLRVIYDLRRGPGQNPFGDGSIAELRKWYELLARHRVSPGLLPPPKFTYADGKVEMDTTEFDAAARICLDELKMNVFYSANLFYAFGWAYKPRPLFGHQAFTDEYTRAFKTCYRAYLDHLKKRGWYDKLVNYISDEPHFSHEHVVEQMKQICNLAHSVDPNVPLYSSTWRHVPAWNGHLDIWGVGQYGCFAVEEMKRRLADGERLWITTDGQQALDTPYLATERLLPYYCFKYGADGYEFWGVSWWTYDPWDRAWHKFISQSADGKDRYWVRYPNGDGYLCYPGDRVGVDGPVSSIRLAQAREGIEDYEYLCVLRELIKRGRGKLQADAINAAQTALDRGRDLVTIPNAGGCRSTEILPDPDVVPAVRRAIAEQIVRLKGLLRR